MEITEKIERNKAKLAPKPIKKVKKRELHELRFDDIKFGEKIGEGSFGQVFKGKLWGQEVALKRLRINGDVENVKDFKKEVRIMK